MRQFVYQINPRILATVGRLAKYLHSEGTPVITNGGHSYEFFSQRTTCEDEFFMLVRTGFLSYKSLALFTVDIFNTYKWKKIFYFYERYEVLLVLYHSIADKSLVTFQGRSVLDQRLQNLPLGHEYSGQVSHPGEYILLQLCHGPFSGPAGHQEDIGAGSGLRSFE